MTDFISLMDARFEGMSGLIGLWTVMLTVVTAYITGLHLFLARSAFIVRLAAFFVLTTSFVMFATMGVIYGEMFLALEQCEGCASTEIVSVIQLLPGGVEIELETFRIWTSFVNYAFGVLIYLMLFVLTFWTGWRDR